MTSLKYIHVKTGSTIEHAVAMILNATDREHDGHHDAEGLTRLVEAAQNYLRCQSHMFEEIGEDR